MKFLLFCILLIVTQLGFAHGEDKYGPHKGFIRMPGAFHTEVVPVGKNKIRVYLLDIDWKNPSVLRSSVEVNLSGQCEIKKNYYECSFPSGVNLQKKGQLIVIAQREGQKGSEAIYELPLKLESKKDSHDHH